MTKSAISTARAPAAIGPYSQGIRSNGLVFVSGQIPLDPSSGEVLEGPITTQVRRVMENLSAILGEAGARLDDVVKTTIYLKNMGDFQAVNAVYAEFFKPPFPARATVEVARLPRDVDVEIDCIAKVSS